MGERVYIIAELGHNWAPDPHNAFLMVEEAAKAGADAVKVQVRTLPDAIPESQRRKRKRLPWDPDVEVDYVEYRRRCELKESTLPLLRYKAAELNLDFGASCWDAGALRRVEGLGPDFLKVASASATDHSLLVRTVDASRRLGVPLLLSTGGCSAKDVREATSVASHAHELWVAQCTSTYPADPSTLNLRAIPRMARDLPAAQVGYSNHATSIAPCVAAIALGARWVEVHVTLDRSMPGTDQAASFEFSGLRKLRKYADTVTAALGDGEKKVEPGEAEVMAKLRRVG